MTGLQTVPCHIAGIRSDIVLLEEKIVSNCPKDQEILVKGFIHGSVTICKVNGPLHYLRVAFFFKHEYMSYQETSIKDL